MKEKIIIVINVPAEFQHPSDEFLSSIKSIVDAFKKNHKAYLEELRKI